MAEVAAPVNTIARWCRSATSIAISSRIEPPGWMIAVTPALAATWMPSGNGKYASDAITASFARSPARRSAMSTDTLRRACAAPIPTVAAFRARTIAFERTWRTARQANRRSVSSPSVGWRRVTTWSWPRSMSTASIASTSRPPPTRLKSRFAIP